MVGITIAGRANEAAISEKSADEGYTEMSAEEEISEKDRTDQVNNPDPVLADERPRTPTESAQSEKIQDSDSLKRRRLLDDPETRKRSQRMFSMLRGTLNKFSADLSSARPVMEARRDIDSKLQQRLLEEKQAIIESKETRRREAENARLAEEVKVKQDANSLVALHNAPFSNFLQTQATPRLFYLPAKHNEKTLALMNGSVASKDVEKVDDRVQDDENVMVMENNVDVEDGTTGDAVMADEGHENDTAMIDIPQTVAENETVTTETLQSMAENEKDVVAENVNDQNKNVNSTKSENVEASEQTVSPDHHIVNPKCTEEPENIQVAQTNDS